MIFSIVWCLTIASCSTRSKSPQGEIPEFGSSEAEENKSLEEKKISLERKEVGLGLELEWLSLKTKLTRAELELNQALSSETKLLSDHSKFKALNHRFPDSRGFISDRDRIVWDARLKARHQQVVDSRAKVNLLSREMQELRYRILQNGFSTPLGSLIK